MVRRGTGARCKGSTALSCEIGHSHSFQSSRSHRTATCHCYPSWTSLPCHRLVICLHHLVSPHVSFFIPPSILQCLYSVLANQHCASCDRLVCHALCLRHR